MCMEHDPILFIVHYLRWTKFIYNFGFSLGVYTLPFWSPCIDDFNDTLVYNTEFDWKGKKKTSK